MRSSSGTPTMKGMTRASTTGSFFASASSARTPCMPERGSTETERTKRSGWAAAKASALGFTSSAEVEITERSTPSRSMSSMSSPISTSLKMASGRLK